MTTASGINRRRIAIVILAVTAFVVMFMIMSFLRGTSLRLAEWEAAVRTGDTATLQQLLEAGIDVDTPVEITRWIREVKIGVEAPATALIVMCSFGDEESVDLLLSYGADPNAQDGSGKPPLFNAILRDDPDLIRMLADAGADIDRLGSKDLTPLIAAAYGCVAAVETLISLGADVNDTGDEGKTALMSASVTDSEKIARLLLEAGADVSAVQSSGLDAFLHAAGHSSVQVMKVLLQYGADPSVSENDGSTALIRAAGHWESADAVRLLLDLGADPNESSSSGVTPLHEAASYGTVEIVRMLLEGGADPLARTEHGRTPLNDARQRDNELEDDIVALDIIALLQAAANGVDGP